MSISILILFILKLCLQMKEYESSRRVSDGEECRKKENTFMVSFTAFSQHFCGGTLMNERYVLTAAHCLSGLQFDVQLIEINQPSGLVSKIDVYFTHPKFTRPPNIYNDVAVAKLRERFKKSDAVSFVVLPPPRCNTNYMKFCRRGNVMGWGLVIDTQLPSTLMCASVPIYPKDKCQRLLRTTAITYAPLDNQICIFSEKDYKNVCKGDSGGPLICNGVQMGIVSFGRGDACGVMKTPAVFTRVDCYLKFIYSSIRRSACGISNRHMRVVGGNISKAHEFPWIAGLSKGGEFYCGATVITRRHILTAAHCVNGFDIRDITVVLADHDRTSNDRLSKLVVRNLKHIEEHEGFDVYTFNNDIALLEMDDPIEFDDIIQPACLPDSGLADYTGKVALIAGWGKTSESDDTSHILRKVSVPVWSKKDCHKSGYGERKISENMICAGYTEGKKDACQGDSGGPLVVSKESGNMEIIGVVSWGRGCGRPNLPGIYTKVTNYLDWIHRRLDGECLCQPIVYNPRRS